MSLSGIQEQPEHIYELEKVLGNQRSQKWKKQSLQVILWRLPGSVSEKNDAQKKIRAGA